MSVYRDALVQDPVYAAERAAYQATKERRVQARALLLPNVNASGNLGYNYSDTKFGSVPMVCSSLWGEKTLRSSSAATALNLEKLSDMPLPVRE